MNAYLRFVDAARNHPGIQGLILGGSRARQLESEDSDTDVYLIIEDSLSSDEIARLKQDLIQEFGSAIRLDLSYHAFQTLSGFENYAVYGTEFMWDRYSLVNAKLEFDKTDGRLARVLQTKQRLTDAEKDIGMNRYFPAYLNKVYRSVVCSQRNQQLGALLNAATSIDFLLGSLFTLHHRVPPYLKYLAWELEHDPLAAIDTLELIRLLAEYR